jgi:hypothetical protein
MNSVIITVRGYNDNNSKLHAMIRWCIDNAGVEEKDWECYSTDSTWDSIDIDFEFTFKKNKVATMFALKFA